MSVTRIDSWRLPGCGPLCYPRRHDYVPHELYGRLLERQEQAARPRGRIVRTGALTVDLDARTATVDGREIVLPPRPWELLAYLAERIGRWCPNDDIRRELWEQYSESATYINCNRFRLRDRLGTAGRLIESSIGGRYAGSGRTRLVRAEVQP